MAAGRAGAREDHAPPRCAAGADPGAPADIELYVRVPQTSDADENAFVDAIARAPQSAATPSPFTPIASYGFLSNCHTGALVAPDGTLTLH